MTRLACISFTLLVAASACNDSATVLTPDTGVPDAGSDVTVPEAGKDATASDVVQSDADDASDATTTSDAVDEADAGLTCEAGAEVCKGTCVDVSTYQTDNTNCGFCGHDCLGNSCTAGMCAPDTIGTGLPNPTVLAVNSTTVYFATAGDFSSTGGAVYQCPVTGCPSKLGSMSAGYNNPESIAIDGNNVYWANTGDLGTANGSVMSCPLANCGKNGSALVTITSGLQWIIGMALDSSNVYFGVRGAMLGDGTVSACPLTGCTGAPSDVITGQAHPDFVLLDSATIYMAQMGGGASIPYVQSGPVPGPSAGTRLFTGNVQSQITGLALNAGQLYFANGFTSEIDMCPTSGCPTTPATFVTTGTSPFDVVIDAKGAYWIDDTGIEFCPLTGCTTPILLATSSNAPMDVALNGSYLYWVEQDGTGTAGQVMRVAR